MNQRREPILIETDRHRITGLITVARDGYRSRISDVLNDFERDFLSLTDATVELLDGSARPSRHAFMAVHRAHIVYVVPGGEQPSGAATAEATAAT